VCCGLFSSIEKVGISLAWCILIFVSQHRSVGMLKVGLGSSTTAEFLAKARNIVTQHRELQNQVEALHSQIGHLEMTQLRAVSLVWFWGLYVSSKSLFVSSAVSTIGSCRLQNCETFYCAVTCLSKSSMFIALPLVQCAYLQLVH